MIKTQEEQRGSNWYVFLIIGILIGAVLGYYASEKGLIKEKVVGKNVDYLEKCYELAKSDCNSYEFKKSIGIPSYDYSSCLAKYNNACREAYG